VEQPVLQHHAGHGDRFALEQREIGDARHTRLVVLQEHHAALRAMQGPPLLDAALQGALAPIPLLIGEGLLQVQQQRLGLQLRSLLEHGNQHAVPDAGQRVSSCTPASTALLLLVLLSAGLRFTTVDALGTAHRDPDRISSNLLTEATGPFGHVSLLDPQRQRGGHRWSSRP